MVVGWYHGKTACFLSYRLIATRVEQDMRKEILHLRIAIGYVLVSLRTAAVFLPYRPDRGQRQIGAFLTCSVRSRYASVQAFESCLSH